MRGLTKKTTLYSFIPVMLIFASFIALSHEFYDFLTAIKVEASVKEIMLEKTAIKNTLGTPLDNVADNQDIAETTKSLLPRNFVTIHAIGAEALSKYEQDDIYHIRVGSTGEIIPVYYTRLSYITMFFPSLLILASILSSYIALKLFIAWKNTQKVHQVVSVFAAGTESPSEETLRLLKSILPTEQSFATLKDVLSRIQSEKKALNRLRGELSANQEIIQKVTKEFNACIHEINNPLAAIENKITNIMSEANHKQLSSLGEIMDILVSARTMLYFRYTKSIEDSSKRRHNNVWLHQLVDESISIAANSSMTTQTEDKLKNLKVKTYVKFADSNSVDSPSSQNIWTDKLCLSGVLINIFKNSFKYSDCTSLNIEVGLSRGNSFSQNVIAEFTITDEGSGFPEQVLKNEHERRTFDGEASFGIGLSIVEDILFEQFGKTLNISNHTDSTGRILGAQVRFSIDALEAEPSVNYNLQPHFINMIASKEDDTVDTVIGMMNRYVNLINERFHPKENAKPDSKDNLAETAINDQTYFEYIGDSDPADSATLLLIIFDRSVHTVDYVRSYGREKHSLKVVLICSPIDYKYVLENGYLSPYYSEESLEVDNENDIIPLDNIYAIKHPFLLIDLIRVAYDDDARTPEEKNSLKKKVLFLEDNDDCATPVIKRLSSGVQVDHVVTCSDGIKALRHSPTGGEYDLIISDTNLNDGSNQPFLDAKNDTPRYRTVPIIIYSATKPVQDGIRFVEKVSGHTGIEALVDEINDVFGIKSARSIAEAKEPVRVLDYINYLDFISQFYDYTAFNGITLDAVKALSSFCHKATSSGAQMIYLPTELKNPFHQLDDELKNIRLTYEDAASGVCELTDQEAIQLEDEVLEVSEKIDIRVEQIKNHIRPLLRKAAILEIEDHLRLLKDRLNDGDTTRYLAYITSNTKQITTAFKLLNEIDAPILLNPIISTINRFQADVDLNLLFEQHMALERLYIKIK